MKNRQLSFFRCSRCRQQKTIIFSFLPIFFILLPSALAGMIVQEKVELVGLAAITGEENSSRSRIITNYYQGKKMRLEADEVIHILDLEKALMFNIDVNAKKYRKTALEALLKLQEQSAQYLEIYKAQQKSWMESLPPETQAALKGKLTGLPTAGGKKDEDNKVLVKPTGREKRINGYQCDEFEVYEEKKKTAVYWLAASVSTAPMDAYQQEFGKWIKGSSSSLQTLFHMKWDHIQDKGFPIKISHFNVVKGRMVYNREVLHVEEKLLDESYFQPPEEYTLDKTSAFPLFDLLLPKEETKKGTPADGKETSQP